MDDLDDAREIAEGLIEQRVDLGGRLAGQRADVDLEVDGVGDDVGLRPSMDHGRSERRVRARVELSSHAERQRIAQLDEALLLQQRPVNSGRVAHRLDEAAPHVVHHGGRPELGEPAHDLGRGHERVVGAERLRRVAGGALDCGACTTRCPSRPR